MKLITWNIQWGRGIDGIVDLARIVKHAKSLADFDVINLQEVADNFPDLPGNDDRDQFAELERLLPGFTAVPGFGVDRAGPNRRRRFGNVLLSRLPILSSRLHALPWPADKSVSSMPRVAIEATIDTAFGPARVTTTHLEYYSILQRRAQANRLRELHDEACARAGTPAKVTNSKGPFVDSAQTTQAILTADFNFPPDEDSYADIQRPLASGGPAYRDAWAIAHGSKPHEPTFCVHEAHWGKGPYCCDFIFVSEDLAPRVRKVAADTDTKLSDHQPVVLELADR